MKLFVPLLQLALALPPGPLMAAEGDVRALFNLTNPSIGPFPSNQFTVPDADQLTGKRVALPKPDCTARPSDCDDIDILNKLDGFSMQPRIGVSFDGAIDPNSVANGGVVIVEFGTGAAPRVIGVNEIVWDPIGNTLYFTSNELLAQRTSYAVIVTTRVTNAAGAAVQASAEFTAFVASGTGSYRDQLRTGLDAAVMAGVSRGSIVVASAFTTLSATAILEKIRTQIAAATPQPASFMTDGRRNVFPRESVMAMTLHYQTRVSPAGFADSPVSLGLFDAVPGAVGTLAFGSYVSPNYLTPEIVLPAVGTLTGKPEVQSTTTLQFALVLPAGTPPSNGWPVAIFGHGNQQTKELMYSFSAILAEHGIATIAINAPGHGYGPLGTMDLDLKSGERVTLTSGGRGVDMDRNGVIGTNEGIQTVGRPYALLSYADGWRQTVVDLLQMVRVIQVGIDVDGDGKADLDSGNIYYLGTSMGGNYGVPLLAVEPAIQAGAITFAGTPRTDSFRLGASRGMQSAFLQQRTPSLLNGPGITQIGGMPFAAPFFNENKPLRNVPPVVNDVDGALDIQEVFARQIWSAQPADPGVYAPHLRKQPLDGMGPKAVLLQLAKADQTVPTPVGMSLVRIGGLESSTTFLRFDLIYAKNPGFPTRNPHQMHLGIGSSVAVVDTVARGMQEQVATFFVSGGTAIPQAEPAEYLETPIQLPLAENVEYVTLNPGVQAPVDAASKGKELAPGGLFTILGTTNTAGADMGVDSGPLPTTLSGVMVSVNGRAVPLSFAGKGMVSGQVPYESAAGAGTAQLVTYGISGAPLPIQVNALAPRLFTTEGNACIARNEDGSTNATNNPAKTGASIAVYLTGLGPVNPPVPTGMPARDVPLSIAANAVSAELAGQPVTPAFAGMIPGSVGVGVVQLVIPATVADGQQNFSITAGSATSNVCRIAVAR